MKKLFNRFLLCMSVVPFVLGSCQEEDFGLSIDDLKHKETVQNYTNNFIERYGVPAADHTWGFGRPQDVVQMPITRAYVANDNSTIDSQRNTWNGGLSNQVNIPGWPNFDGYYYASQGGGANLGSINKDPKGYPTGDITEFEIQYVSAWFRTHHFDYDEMMAHRAPIHWTDYFIQNVCADDDQLKYDPLPAGQVTGKNGNNIHSNESQGAYMQSVYFKPFKNQEIGWIHFSNFDHSNATYNPEEKSQATNNRYRQIQYIHHGGTEDFCTKFGNEQYNNWVLVELRWTEIGADNAPHDRVGYYLAFDYYDVKNGATYGDGYFSNWIIKISPATIAPDPDPVPPYVVTRVMCEDLGNTYDFDFNDVVFDVKLEPALDGTYTALINLQAAGGTLPIYVGVNPDELTSEEEKQRLEAHHMLGADNSDSPINVDPSGDTKPVAIYRVGGLTSNWAYDVPVYVVKNGFAYNIVNGQGNDANPDDYSEGIQQSDMSHSVNRTDNNVPQKIAMPTSVKWMNECEFIENGYSAFADWVKGGDIDANGQLKYYGSNHDQLWYKVYYDPKKIHNFYNYAPGTAIGGAGAFIGIQIELTPNTIDAISDIEKGVLQIAAWKGQAPIWKHLETLTDNDYYTITVVYNGNPGVGVVLPVNGTNKSNLVNNMTGNSVGTPNMFPAEALIVDGAPNGYYTHRFSYKKTAAVHGSGYCDYMVLFLENNTLPDDVEVTGMYISYDHEQREGSYLLPAGTYKQQK